MQSAYLKILLPAIALVITALHPSTAQTSHFRLKTADSLYRAKMYTQSYEHYTEILRQKQYTPAMLLKMAYIQEGLNNIGNAMYYLNLYFTVTNDKAALQKMEELAARFDLEGYEVSDSDRFLTFYHDSYNYISITLAALSVLFVSMVFYTRVRLKRRPVITGSFLMLFLVGFLVHVNFGDKTPLGIISNPKTYVMDGPSPGATLVTIASDGHRVEIIGKEDVWIKIRWEDGQVGYIRKNSLLPIEI
jgi:hypothetical protein